MHPVSVLILHRPAPAGAGAPLTTLVADARGALAGRQAGAFVRAGAADARVVAEAVEESFGARLRRLAKTLPAGHGLVVLGSGSIPLATSHDLGALVGAAASAAPGALANNRYSADVVALSAPVVAALRDLPDLPGDNALPRWLEEVAGIPVADLRTRWRLAIDLDAPADLLLPGVLAATGLPRPAVLAEAADRLAAVLATLADRRAEVAIAGRTSAATLVALESRAAARIRALVEERGMRAATRLARGDGTAGRPPRSVLGMLLDDRGPGAFGTILAGISDAAIIDTRVLLGHRFGAEEAGWPSAEDRFASDLLRPAEIADPWLRELTEGAASAPIPVVLGGHSLVGPGVRAFVAHGVRR